MKAGALFDLCLGDQAFQARVRITKQRYVMLL